jgi:hypothetical protein
MVADHQKYGDEVKAETTLRIVMRGMPMPPTADPLPT